MNVGLQNRLSSVRCYALLPIISEIAYKEKVRPERPLSVATVKTLYPVGLALGVPPQVLLALFPAVNGYFFLPNYATEVAAIGFDRTGTTSVGRYVINHSFQLSGFITTFVSIGVGYLLCCCLLG